MARKINLFQYIVNAGIQLLQQKELNLEVEKDNLSDIEIFLDDLKITNPELFQVPINANLIDDLHKVSDDIKQTYIRKKERRDSIKERRRSSLTFRRSSLEIDVSATVSRRRQSESSLSVRRRSSGNIESFQNRSYKSSNNPDIKQHSLKTSNVEEINNQKWHDSHKSNGHSLDSGNKKCRRRSSGAICDLGLYQSSRIPQSPKQKDDLFLGSNISDTIKETCHEAEKLLHRLKINELNQSNKHRTVRGGNSKSTYKSYLSWSGNKDQENCTNWRRKDNQE